MATARPTSSREARRRHLADSFSEAIERLLGDGDTYSDLSVETLITEVGISRFTFYAYFGDKGDLLQAVGEEVTTDLAGAGAPWFEFSATANRDDLREALRPLFETYRRHQTVLRAIAEAAAYDPRIRDVHRALVDRAATALQAHIEEQQRARTAAADLDAEQTSLWLVWMLERGLQQLVAHASATELERLLSSMTDIAWRTLYKGA
jgi:AcrR family transcriptional regulator